MVQPDSDQFAALHVSLTGKFLVAGGTLVGADIGGMVAYVVRRGQESQLVALGFGAWQDSVWAHFVPGHSAAFTAFQPFWNVAVQCSLTGAVIGFLLMVICLPQAGGRRRILYGVAAALTLWVPLIVLMRVNSPVLMVDLDQRVISGGDLGGPISTDGLQNIGTDCQWDHNLQMTLCSVTVDTGTGLINLLSIGGVLYAGQEEETRQIADGLRQFVNGGVATP